MRKGKIKTFKDDLQSFTLLRFYGPEFIDYKGKILVIDPDVFAIKNPKDISNFLNQDNYTKRMVNQYGYCSKESYGFLIDLKKKYKFDLNPKIVNYDVLPSSNWIIYNSSQDFEKKPGIFLNYQKEPSLKFNNL